MDADIQTIGTWWMWGVFFAIVLIMLFIDLFWVGGAQQHRVSVKEAAVWSLVWITISLLFGAGLWWYLDNYFTRELANTKTLEYITGYLIEKSLAVDNVFVWLMLFSFFSIPLELQKRILILGVFGAIVMRTIMIFLGVWLITQFHWILYLFGAFLLFTGLKMFGAGDQKPEFDKNPVVIWMGKHLRITSGLHGERFFIRLNGLLYATPLLIALVLVEISDLIFAVDSIPAIFAITTDPFILLTSNVFAILGLRAMYFLVANMADRFSLLQYGLALVLIFIGGKMLLMDVVKIPIGISLAVVALLIGGAIFLSLRRKNIS